MNQQIFASLLLAICLSVNGCAADPAANGSVNNTYPNQNTSTTTDGTTATKLLVGGLIVSTLVAGAIFEHQMSAHPAQTMANLIKSTS